MDVVAGLHDRTYALLADMAASGALPGDLELGRFTVLPGDDPGRGDLVVNAGSVYGRAHAGGVAGLASAVAQALGSDPAVAAASVAGPGLVNLSLSAAALSACLVEALATSRDYGRGSRRPPLGIALPSAWAREPLGPDRARAAVVADALSRILAFAGHAVVTSPAVDGLLRENHLGATGSIDAPMARSRLDRPPGMPGIVVHAARRRGGRSGAPADFGFRDGDEVVAVASCRLVSGAARRGPGASPGGVTLAEAVSPADGPALRFAMLCRGIGAPLDLDPGVAADASEAGPLFFVRYAHARARGTLRQAAATLPACDLAPSALAQADFVGLRHPGERAIARLVALYPDRIAAAAAEREPFRLAAFLAGLARAVHDQWKTSKDQPQLRFVNEEQRDLTKARLGLMTAAALVLHSGLDLLGLSAPDEMR